MNKLTLTLPGNSPIPAPSGLKTPTGGQFTDLASFISPLLDITFYIATFLAFYFLVWGAFAYLMARGNKEDLAKARARITWAIVGLIVVFSAYFIAKFGAEIFPPTRGGLPF